MDDNESSTNFLNQVAALGAIIGDLRVAIYRLQYDYMAFGSWELVAGRRSRKLRFTYDGKDSYLSYCDDSKGPKSHSDLKHVRVATRDGENPLDVVNVVLAQEFSE